MDHLKSMRIFVRILEEGGLASAARALDLAPAVVTRALSDLEAHLGVRLINRTTRRLALTEIGEQYLERTRATLADIDATEALVSSAHSEPRGTVRLRAPTSFAIHQLAKHLPKFHALFPNVTVDVSTFGAVGDLDENHDITILWRHRALEGDFIARRLARSEVILCAAPDYLDRRGRPLHPCELADHAVLLPPATLGRQGELTFYRDSRTGELADAEVFVFKDKARAPMTTLNADLTYAGSLAGLGICSLPSFVVEDAVLDQALEHVLPEWRLCDATLWACMPSRKHVPTRTRALLEFLVDAFGGSEHDPWLAAAVCAAREATAERA
jgi:DNA-binding transcriptional LysR family regulator